MTSLDEMTRSLKDLYQRLAISGKRTAVITRLRMELAGLDKQRNEVFTKLGERIDELRRTDQINDAGLLGLLEGEFDGIDRVRRRIQETMTAIQEINLQGAGESDDPEIVIEDGPEDKVENLLDSFEVL